MSRAVSVLVPVYNVSDYIEKCAHSLFNQTLNDIEFVFVNDACNDDSITKLENVIALYPHLKSQIRIVHNKENLGQAQSRNVALDLAEGEYVLFVDSDDYVEPDMLEVMNGEAIRTNADIVVADMLIEFLTKTVHFQDEVSSDNDVNFVKMLSNDGTSPSLCNKLVRRSLYLMPECRNTWGMKYMEDRFVSIRLYYFAEKIIRVNRPFYHYIKHNPASANSVVTQAHFRDTQLFWTSVESFLQNRGKQDRFIEQMGLQKMKDKATLMLGTNSVLLRKEFAEMFAGEERFYQKKLKTGEKILLTLVRNKLFFMTGLLRQLILFKNRISNK